MANRGRAKKLTDPTTTCVSLEKSVLDRIKAKAQQLSEQSGKKVSMGDVFTMSFDMAELLLDRNDSIDNQAFETSQTKAELVEEAYSEWNIKYYY